MTQNGNIICALIFFCTVLVLNSADNIPNDDRRVFHEEVKLHKALLTDYRPDYRPVKDHNSSVIVEVRFALKYVNFDIVEEIMNLQSWVTLSWKDEFLKWTPSDYGDINKTYLNSFEIWTPQMSLFNADANQWDGFHTTCSVSHDGTVTCIPDMSHSGICRMILRRWPYDSQKCTLYFGSWMHTADQINFTFFKIKPVILDDFQNGAGWILINVTNERLERPYSNTPMLKYTFILKREAAGPASIVVIPSIAIVLLTLTSLLLDIKDNTRLLLVCFSLFGHFTFLSEIGYSIPKHSADTPILLLFVRDSMIMTLVAILATLVLMGLRRRVVPAPTWIATTNRLVSTGPGKYVIFTVFRANDTSDEKPMTEDFSSINIGQEPEEKSDVSDWIKFANILNSCLFIISCIVYSVLIISYIPVDD